MSDWNFLNKHRVGPGSVYVPPQYWSTPDYGFNGLFRFIADGRLIRCIASDGAGWKHVSVSIEGDKRTPTWSIMATVKDLFWEPEDWVVQFHPAHREYVNNHPGCLHLWQCTYMEMPTPESILVGLRDDEINPPPSGR